MDLPHLETENNSIIPDVIANSLAFKSRYM